MAANSINIVFFLFSNYTKCVEFIGDDAKIIAEKSGKRQNDIVDKVTDNYGVENLNGDFSVFIIDCYSGRTNKKYILSQCSECNNVEIVSIEKILPSLIMNKGYCISENFVVKFGTEYYAIKFSNGVMRCAGCAEAFTQYVSITESDFCYIFNGFNICEYVELYQLNEQLRGEIESSRKKLVNFERETGLLIENYKQNVMFKEQELAKKHKEIDGLKVELEHQIKCTNDERNETIHLKDKCEQFDVLRESFIDKCKKHLCEIEDLYTKYGHLGGIVSIFGIGISTILEKMYTMEREFILGLLNILGVPQCRDGMDEFNYDELEH